MGEFSRPYMTPRERAEERRRLGSGMGAGYISRQDESGGKAHVPVWRVEQMGSPEQVILVRCPSRSGAKIFAHNTLGMKGPFLTDVMPDADIPPDYKIHDPVFETVQQFAARVEQENRSKKK